MAVSDAYEILPACDVLITDYSSIAYDFLLLDRPIVYFVPDLDRYVEHRNVYFTLEEMAAGPIVTQLDELYRLLSGPVPPIDPERHHALRQLLWNGYDGHANAQDRALPRRCDRRAGGRRSAIRRQLQPLARTAKRTSVSMSATAATIAPTWRDV